MCRVCCQCGKRIGLLHQVQLNLILTAIGMSCGDMASHRAYLSQEFELGTLACDVVQLLDCNDLDTIPFGLVHLLMSFGVR